MENHDAEKCFYLKKKKNSFSQIFIYYTLKS